MTSPAGHKQGNRSTGQHIFQTQTILILFSFKCHVIHSTAKTNCISRGGGNVDLSIRSSVSVTVSCTVPSDKNSNGATHAEAPEKRANNKIQENQQSARRSKSPTEGVGGYRLMDLPIGEMSEMCLRESMMMLSKTLSLSLCVFIQTFFFLGPAPNVFVIIWPIHHLYVSQRST